MIIHDGIYGTVKVEEKASEIVGTEEFQRLNSIKQLGFSYLVFPGATHTRFEHSLGTYHISEEAGRNLGMNSDEIRQVALAGLLHDIGHAPYSHSLEDGVVNLYKKDHLKVSTDLISGNVGSGKIRSILKADLDDVLNILENKNGILGRLISGNGDMDQIDYLARDSYYTGVALGAVDAPRILSTIQIHSGKFCVMEKGLPALEGLMVARMLMYRTVYRHKISQIASTIAGDALIKLSPDYKEFVTWDDCDFLSEMKTNRFTRATYEELKHRNLPHGFIIDADEKEFENLLEEIRGQIETSRYFKSPYKKEVIEILDGEQLKPITELSGIMEYLGKELQGSGVVIFKKENEEKLRSVLLSTGLKFQ